MVYFNGFIYLFFVYGPFTAAENRLACSNYRYVSKLAKVIMFADDTNLFFSGAELTTMNDAINQELMLLSKWFKLNKLSLNIKKTNYMLFRSKSKKNLKDLNVLIDGTNVLEVTKTKFLGVIINNTLTWTDHVTMIKGKITKNIGIISRMRFLMPRAVLVSLYHALVEPYIQYCNLIWGSHRTAVLSELYVCQKKLVRIITNSDRRCHSAPLFKKLDILTIFNINDLQVGCYMYAVVNKLLPEFFNSMFIRNSTVHTHCTRNSTAVHQQQYRLNISKFSIRICGPKLWNSLDKKLQCLPTLKTFKKAYRQILIANV